MSERLVGFTVFKTVETSEPRLAGSIPVHLRQQIFVTLPFGNGVSTAALVRAHHQHVLSIRAYRAQCLKEQRVFV